MNYILTSNIIQQSTTAFSMSNSFLSTSIYHISKCFFPNIPISSHQPSLPLPWWLGCRLIRHAVPNHAPPPAWHKACGACGSRWRNTMDFSDGFFCARSWGKNQLSLYLEEKMVKCRHTLGSLYVTVWLSVIMFPMSVAICYWYCMLQKKGESSPCRHKKKTNKHKIASLMPWTKHQYTFRFRMDTDQTSISL